MPACTIESPEFVAFMDACKERANSYYAQYFTNLTPPTFSAMDGKRYIRVVREDSGRSVHCFIDKTNGDILKAAGWKAPAKHARGNIFNSSSVGMTPYGAAYLR